METLQAPPPLKSTASAPPAPASEDDHAHLGLDALVASRRAHPQDGASEESKTTQQGMNGNDLSAPSLQSPGIKVELHDQGQGQGEQEAVPQEPRPQLAATLPK